jgi:hypothetical protein
MLNIVCGGGMENENVNVNENEIKTSENNNSINVNENVNVIQQQPTATEIKEIATLTIEGKELINLIKKATIDKKGEIGFYLKTDGLTIKQIDGAGISLVIVKAKNLLTYKANSEKVIGFNASDLLIFSKIFKKDKVYTIEFYENEIIVKSNNLKAKLNTIELSSSNIIDKEPVFEDTTNFVIEKSQLKDILSNYREYNTITFKVENNEVVSELKNEINELTFNLNPIDKRLTENDKATYNLEYLNDFLKNIDNREVIKISFSTDKPAKIETADAIFYIAPIVEQ